MNKISKKSRVNLKMFIFKITKPVQSWKNL